MICIVRDALKLLCEDRQECGKHRQRRPARRAFQDSKLEMVVVPTPVQRAEW